jgi:hypothetical protein
MSNDAGVVLLYTAVLPRDNGRFTGAAHLFKDATWRSERRILWLVNGPNCLVTAWTLPAWYTDSCSTAAEVDQPQLHVQCSDGAVR